MITPWDSKEGDDDSASVKSSASADSKDALATDQGANQGGSKGTEGGTGSKDGRSAGAKGAKGEKVRREKKGEPKKGGKQTLRAPADIASM